MERRADMARRIRKALMLSAFALPAILPLSCTRPLLEGLTPFLIDGSSTFVTDIIFGVSPLVL